MAEARGGGFGAGAGRAGLAQLRGAARPIEVGLTFLTVDPLGVVHAVQTHT